MPEYCKAVDICLRYTFSYAVKTFTERQKNMKIGIFTYHRAINYGAFLQAYSLSERVKSDFPDADVEIIDYDHKNRQWFIKKCPIVFLYRRSIKDGIRKYHQIREFKKALSELSLGKPLISVSVKKVESFISNNYDLVIVGSDSVFNWSDLGLPNPYFLAGVKNTLKVSYAASAHLQKYEGLPEEQQKYLEKALSDYSYIGVRDNNTKRFTEKFANRKAEHNCDPAVFLKLDFPEYDLKEKLLKHGFDFEKKIVFAMLMKPEPAKYIKEYFGDGYSIVALNDNNKYADTFLYDLNPFEWAHIFKYGNALVTDYFHGTIFGLKNGIPVMSVDSSMYNNGNYESKVYDLLNNRLNLPQCYVNYSDLTGRDGFINFKKSMDKIMSSFDKEGVERAFRKESETYNSFFNAVTELIDSET